MPTGRVVPSFSERDAEKDGDEAAEEDLGAASDAFDDVTGFSERGVLAVCLGARHCGRLSARWVLELVGMGCGSREDLERVYEPLSSTVF